jgi:glutathione S-transferase
MIELYHYSNSICSERVRMALHEKGISDWVSHHVDLFKGEQFAPEYVAINPKAETPTLVDDGHVVRESALICEYIDDAYPDPALKPGSAWRVARMREWVKWSDDQLYEAVAALSFVSIFRKTLNDKGPQAKEAHFRSQTDLARIMRQRSCVDEGFDSPYVVRGVSNVRVLFNRLDTALSDARPWLLGDTYTLAEIAYSPFIARLAALNLLDLFLLDCPRVAQWWQRCSARPSFDAADVGPARGDESERYLQAGTANRDGLKKLIRRLDTEHPYDLATPPIRESRGKI